MISEMRAPLYTLILISVLVVAFGCQPMQQSADVAVKPISNPRLLYPWSVVKYNIRDISENISIIDIEGLQTPYLGYLAERNYIKVNYPELEIKSQSVLTMGNRYIDKFQLESGGMDVLSLWFDATEFYGASTMGRWLVEYDDGSSETGYLQEGDLEQLWMGNVNILLGRVNATGTLTYQIEDEMNNGLWGSGKILDGLVHGEWRLWRQSEGQVYANYLHGVQHGLDISWDSNRVLRSKIDWRKGELEGPAAWWDESGAPVMAGTYHSGIVVSTNEINLEITNKE